MYFGMKKSNSIPAGRIGLMDLYISDQPILSHRQTFTFSFVLGFYLGTFFLVTFSTLYFSGKPRDHKQTLYIRHLTPVYQFVINRKQSIATKVNFIYYRKALPDTFCISQQTKLLKKLYPQPPLFNGLEFIDSRHT